MERSNFSVEPCCGMDNTNLDQSEATNGVAHTADSQEHDENAIRRRVDHALMQIASLSADTRMKNWNPDDLFLPLDSDYRLCAKDDADAEEVTFDLFPPGTFVKGEAKSGRKGSEVGDKRKRCDSADDATINTSKKRRFRFDEGLKLRPKLYDEYQQRVVELINACLRPEELQEHVWIGNPIFERKVLPQRGHISKLIYYLTLVLIEIRKRIHDEHNGAVIAYCPYDGEGKTLHELLTFGDWSEHVQNKFRIGQRGGLGKVIQAAIMSEFNISKEEFKKRHLKKKHEYSENYMVVYRPEEFAVVKKCIENY